MKIITVSCSKEKSTLEKAREYKECLDICIPYDESITRERIRIMADFYEQAIAETKEGKE